MKKVVITLFTVFLVVVSSATAAEPKKDQPQIQQSGRYQIIPVEYNSINLNGDNVKKAVLKIDTLTGETWILNDDVFKTSDGKIISNRGWEKLERYVETKDNILIKQGP